MRYRICALLICGLFIAGAASLRAQSANPAGAGVRAKIQSYLRERFSLPASAVVDVGALEPSIFPGYSKTKVTISLGANKTTQDFYVTPDGAYLIAGALYGLNGSPDKQVERLINLKDQPSAGPANAPVTIVEYADLECPHCAEMQQFIEKQLLPKYGGKIRIVFKEYPLYTMHPWAVAAAIADECAYQIKPSAFLPFRTLIFEDQNTIQPTILRQQLLDLGAQAGVDKDKLAACYDAKTTLPEVRADYVEGNKLGVNQTPTFFINGKLAPGVIAPEQFFKLVDEALAQSEKSTQAAK